MSNSKKIASLFLFSDSSMFIFLEYKFFKSFITDRYFSLELIFNFVFECSSA